MNVSRYGLPRQELAGMPASPLRRAGTVREKRIVDSHALGYADSHVANATAGHASGALAFEDIVCRSMSVMVTVVVPTLHRPVLLERCMLALLDQDLDPSSYEIVVVDDGPDPLTRAVVEAAASSAGTGVAVRYLASARVHGPAAARNIGWRAARADIIAFTDDDTIPSRTWLREGLRVMRGAVVAAAGAIRVPIGKRPTDHEKNVARLARSEFATANCFVRRNALLAIGGFDQRFAEAWREDSDLQFMLLSRGGIIVSAPQAIVTHPVRRAGAFDCLREQHKVVFDALLYKKHPTLYRLRIRRYPRWDYYGIVSLLLIAAAAASIGETDLAWLSALLWAGFVAALCRKRLDGISRKPVEVAGVIVTSVAIPLASVYWRMVGAIRFRTLLF